MRKAVKWGAPAVSAALVFAWMRSGHRIIVLAGPGGCIASINGGRLNLEQCLDWNPNFASVGSGIGEYRSDFEWWFDGGWRPAIRWVKVPLWAPVGALVYAGAAAWRLDARARRRDRADLCKKCGYDRSGLPLGSVCPECGAATVAA